MNVCLLHTISSEDRVSMDVYGRQLSGALRAVGGDRLKVRDYYPDEPPWVVALRRLPTGRAIQRYVRRYGVYQWEARHIDADVEHIVDHGYGHLAFSLDRRRTVVTFHDALLLKLQKRELPTDSYPWLTMLGHRLSLAAISKVARVITDSESGKRDLLRFLHYDPSRVRVVPLGVSPHFRPPAIDHRLDVANGPKRILHVGHCGAYKNIEGILRSLPMINARLPERVVFTKVGGAFTPRQQALIEQLGIAKDIEYLGKVADDRLPVVYGQVDALLMPSLHEGFGLPVLEAMACCTPVVVSRCGSLAEVAGDAAVYTASTYPEDIADAVVRLLTDRPLYGEMRQRGLEMSARFTWERTASATLKVYDEVEKGAKERLVHSKTQRPN